MKPFLPVPKPSAAKAAAKKTATAKKTAAKKAPAAKAPAKKAAKKKTPAKPKPNTGLMCRKCNSTDITVSSQLVQRTRGGKKIKMANCRCHNAHEFQSRHPDAIKASREADKQGVATVHVVAGIVQIPTGGFQNQRARESTARQAGHTHGNKEADGDADDDEELVDLADDDDDEPIERDPRDVSDIADEEIGVTNDDDDEP